MRKEGQAEWQLSEELYNELHSIAANWMRRERPDGILQTTMIVHEAYLRLSEGQESSRWKSREEFCAAASVTMRRLLVDHARRKRSAKRGGGQTQDILSDTRLGVDDEQFGAIELHDALEALAGFAAEQSRALELMYFGGLTGDEIASLLGVSPATVDRRLRAAKAWLRRELKQAARDDGADST